MGSVVIDIEVVCDWWRRRLVSLREVFAATQSGHSRPAVRFPTLVFHSCFFSHCHQICRLEAYVTSVGRKVLRVGCHCAAIDGRDCGKVVETLSNAFCRRKSGSHGLRFRLEIRVFHSCPNPAYPPGSLGGDRGSFVGGAPISRVPLRCQFRGGKSPGRCIRSVAFYLDRSGRRILLRFDSSVSLATGVQGCTATKSA